MLFCFLPTCLFMQHLGAYTYYQRVVKGLEVEIMWFKIKIKIWTNNAWLLCVWSSKFPWMSHLAYFTIVSAFHYGPFERGLIEHPIARSHSILRNLEGFWNPLWGLWCFRVSGNMKVDSWHFVKRCAYALMDASLQAVLFYARIKNINAMLWGLCSLWYYPRSCFKICSNSFAVCVTLFSLGTIPACLQRSNSALDSETGSSEWGDRMVVDITRNAPGLYI